MSERPWFKFFPADWRADTSLKMVSMGARALWLEMLCIMHEGTPRGFLTVRGKQVQPRQLAVLVGCGLDEVEALLAELEDAEIFSRSSAGVIHSRKMARETQVSEDQRGRVKKRWKKTDVENADEKGPGNTKGDTGSDTEVIPICYIPEPEVDAEAKASTSAAPPKPPPKSTRGTRLPETWAPSEIDDAYARKAGLNVEEIDRGAEEFRNYWCARAGRDATKLDWSRTWQNRILALAERKCEREQRLAPRPTNGQGGGRGPVSFADIHAQRYPPDREQGHVSAERPVVHDRDEMLIQGR